MSCHGRHGQARISGDVSRVLTARRCLERMRTFLMVSGERCSVTSLSGATTTMVASQKVSAAQTARQSQTAMRPGNNPGFTGAWRRVRGEEQIGGGASATGVGVQWCCRGLAGCGAKCMKQRRCPAMAVSFAAGLRHHSNRRRQSVARGSRA